MEPIQTNEIAETKLLPKVEFLNHLKNPTRLRKLTVQDIEALERDDIVIKENVMGSDVAKEILKEVDLILSQGKFKPAAMGRYDGSWADNKTRGDVILWLNGDKRWALQETSPNTFEVLNKIDAFRKELNEYCQFDSQHTQAQLACYPGGGARYAKHLDAYVGGNDFRIPIINQSGTSRRLTVIYYANTEWKPEHGGCLRVHYADGTTRDIEPKGDRVVMFQSRRVWHEVLPAFEKRFAIATWFY